MNEIPDDIVLTGKEFKKMFYKSHSKNRSEWYNSKSQEEKKELNKKYSKHVICEICNVQVINTNMWKHKKSKKHINNHNLKFPDNKIEYTKPEKTWYDTNKIIPDDNNPKKYLCLKCNSYVFKTNKISHEKSKKHLE